MVDIVAWGMPKTSDPKSQAASATRMANFRDITTNGNTAIRLGRAYSTSEQLLAIPKQLPDKLPNTGLEVAAMWSIPTIGAQRVAFLGRHFAKGIPSGLLLFLRKKVRCNLRLEG